MYRKQFIRFFNSQDTSFLGAALARLPEKAGFAAPILLYNNDHRFLVREEVDRAGISPKAVILEPIAQHSDCGRRADCSSRRSRCDPRGHAVRSCDRQ